MNLIQIIHFCGSLGLSPSTLSHFEYTSYGLDLQWQINNNVFSIIAKKVTPLYPEATLVMEAIINYWTPEERKSQVQNWCSLAQQLILSRILFY